MADHDATPLGWALIGCGGAGRAHARGASSTPEIAIRGFCDVLPEAAARFGEEFGGAYQTTDPAEIFADPQVDIVSIATSHQSHADLAVAACRAGKHLFLEKPMAMSTPDCQRIQQAVSATGIRLMINFSIRFSGAAQEIKQRLGSPRVSHAQCTMNPADLSVWRWDPEEGGGPLYDVGVHAVDLLCWMHRADPEEVYATGGQVTHPGELGSPDLVDTAAATIRFADASVATFLMSDAGSNVAMSKWFFEFFDGEQSAVLHEHFTAATFTWPDAATGQPASETLKPEPVERLPLLVEAIRTDTEPDPGARAGMVSTLLVEKIAASIHTGLPQKIEVPDL